MVSGLYTGYVIILAWISNTIPRPAARRAAALAFTKGVANAASIYVPYMYGRVCLKLTEYYVAIRVLSDMKMQRFKDLPRRDQNGER